MLSKLHFVSTLRFERHCSAVLICVVGALLAFYARGATITIVGTMSSQSGSSSCLYTSISEDGLGNWTFNCGAGSKSAVISPSPSAATCSSYEAISEDSSGNWFVAGCVSPGPPPPTVFYVHSDHLGTPRVITRSADNQVVWRWDNTEPFGASAASENPAGIGNFRSDMRFPGQRYDAETGTHYNYFRDYDSSLGRYLQSDPIGLEGGLSTYGYVGGNPLTQFDRYGLDYWIENAAESEQSCSQGCGYHQSVCVGQPGGKVSCIAFGRKPGQGECWFDCKGYVYWDRSGRGPIERDTYRRTDKKTDTAILSHMRQQIGQESRYDILFMGRNCRAFANNFHNDLVSRFGGSSAP